MHFFQDIASFNGKFKESPRDSKMFGNPGYSTVIHNHYPAIILQEFPSPKNKVFLDMALFYRQSKHFLNF